MTPGRLEAFTDGVVLLMAAICWVVPQWSIVACNGPRSRLAVALGKDWKGKLSMVLYVVAIPLAFASAWIAVVLYALIAGLWLVPDRRIGPPRGAASAG